MIDRDITLADGRNVSVALYGAENGHSVVWCHGGPGTRLEPAGLEAAAEAAGLRLIALDRPGYGRSTPKPGRSISDWVPDAVEVIDQLGVQTFIAVGVSTGGVYALALSSALPDRAQGAVVCCAMTDMRSTEHRADFLALSPIFNDVWNASDRDSALAGAAAMFGLDGSGAIGISEGVEAISETDRSAVADGFADLESANMREMFAFGVQGFVDDRIADGVGWGSFDVTTITCPVRVIHGDEDSFVPIRHAEYTAHLVPGATLRVYEGLGHFTIVSETITNIVDLIGQRV